MIGFNFATFAVFMVGEFIVAMREVPPPRGRPIPPISPSALRLQPSLHATFAAYRHSNMHHPPARPAPRP